MKQKTKKKLYVIFSIIIGLPIIFTLFLMIFWVINNKSETYIEKTKEIDELKFYFKSIVPDKKHVEIEFDNKNHLVRFGIDDSLSHGSNFLEWDLDINSAKTDSIINTLGWTRITLKEIKQKLHKANCIGIDNGEPIKIDLERFFTGMSSYLIFEKPMSDEDSIYYRNSERHRIINKKLVILTDYGAYD